MKTSRFLILPVFILATSVAACFIIMRTYKVSQNDVIMYNNIVQTIKENWGSSDPLNGNYYGMTVYIYDNEGFPVYYSDNAPHPESVTQALKEGYLCIAVTDQSRFLGTAVFPSPEKEHFIQAGNSLLVVAVIMFSGFAVSCIIFCIYTEINVIRPFRKMKEFAARIAAGQLDEPLTMEKNNIFGIFTESFDIMREELIAARKRENDLKIKEKELVASLSHDLKTPIAGIKVICELLSVKIKDAYILEKIYDIQQKSDHMAGMVSDLLASALDDLGEMTVNCTDESSLILHELIITNDPRSLVREESLPECLIKADRSRMSQIIGNIISNSYKYADTPIDVRYVISDDYLKMSFTDYGKGVPEDELDLITNKFYRGRDVRTSGTDGSGLGLYISSELIAKMGGELVCSSRGDGLTVTLFICLS